MTIRCRTALLLLCAGCAPNAPEVYVTAAGDEMIAVPAGSFRMGSASGDADEQPVHEVRLDGFLIDRYEVRQSMFERLELSNPSRVKGADHPADNLTWVLAARFCNERSRAEGLEPCYDEQDASCDFEKNGYRLPTEAEWEYACRAGSTGDYSFGSDLSRLGRYAWFADNASGDTRPVGSKLPNAWGLHDMHGNVAEWCNDPYEPQYYQSSPSANPRGPADAELFVVRGGAYNSSKQALRSAARGRDRPGFGDACLAPDILGLLCVRKLPDDKDQ